MEIKIVSTKDELFAVCHMAASSNAQNESLSEEFHRGSLNMEDCLILKEGQRIYGRIILNRYLTYLTLEKIPVERAVGFLKEACNRIHEKHIVIHLYSDKSNHELVKTSLLLSDFVITQEKESYICQPYAYPIKADLRDGRDVEDTLFIEMIQACYEQNQDRSIRKDAIRYGRYKAAVKLFTELIEQEPLTYRQMLFVNGTPAGIVFLNTSSEKYRGIGYLAVHPAFRAQGLGKVLLQAACALAAKEKSVSTIIGDIDVRNAYIRDIVQACAFELSCQELVFEKNS